MYGTNSPDNMFFGLGNGSVPASGNLVRDNVFANGRILYVPQANWGTNDHNLSSGRAGTGNMTGTPIFVGGQPHELLGIPPSARIARKGCRLRRGGHGNRLEA